MLLGINVQNRVGNAGLHRTVFGDKLTEADGKPLVDTAALKAMLCLLRVVQVFNYILTDSSWIVLSGV